MSIWLTSQINPGSESFTLQKNSAGLIHTPAQLDDVEELKEDFIISDKINIIPNLKWQKKKNQLLL